MPTLLELVGVEIPQSVQGDSLVPILECEDHKERDYIVSSWPLYNPGEFTYAIDSYQRRVAEPLPSTITSRNGWALIYGMEGWPAELYDLRTDPTQKNNLFYEKRDVADILLQKYISFLKKSGTSKNLLIRRSCF